MKAKVFLIVFSLMAGLVFFQCETDDDDDDKQKLTQEKLNAATNQLASFTGNTGEGAIPHGGPEGFNVDSTFRDVFSGMSSLGASFPEGTVIAKRTYRRFSDGTKGDLLVTFAMFKREAGYDPENGDWEYVQMPFSQDVNYTENPNGQLNASNVARGKLSGCISCHAVAGGDDYVFTND